MDDIYATAATGCCSPRLHACMHACMHAAGTKSAIPPPLSHPLSPTLFVSLTVLFAPLCPPSSITRPRRTPGHDLLAGKWEDELPLFSSKKGRRRGKKGAREKYGRVPLFLLPLFFFFFLFRFSLPLSLSLSLCFLFDRSRFLFLSFFFLLPLLDFFPFPLPFQGYRTARNNTCWR